MYSQCEQIVFSAHFVISFVIGSPLPTKQRVKFHFVVFFVSFAMPLTNIYPAIIYEITMVSFFIPANLTFHLGSPFPHTLIILYPCLGLGMGVGVSNTLPSRIRYPSEQGDKWKH